MTTPFRVSRAAMVAAMFLFAASASAQATTRTDLTTSPAVDDAMRVGVLGGLEFEDDTGFGLRGDLELMPVARVGNGTLKLLGSASWTYFGQDEGGVDVTTNVFRLIPGVRLAFPLQDRVGIYGDAGLGLYHARLSVDDVFVPGVGNVGGGDDSETSLVARIAGGGYYAMSPSMRIVAEIGVLPHFGDFDINPFTLFGGVSFAF